MNDAATSIAEEMGSRWKPYPVYKDSGVEWLGEIPEHWEIKRLKLLTSFVTSGSRGWAQYYRENGAIFLRIGNLSRTSIDLDFRDIQYVCPPQDAEGERTRVNQHDVLISITAYIGSVAVVAEDIGEAYVNQHIALTRPRKKVVVPKWLGYCLLSQVGRAQFSLLLYGGTKDGLGLDDVNNLLVLMPPMGEQRTIAPFLDRETTHIDTLIATKERLIELLAEKRAALISHAVTKGLDLTVPMKDSGVEWLGEIPAHWIPKKIKYLFRQTKRQNYADLTVLSVYRDYGVIEKESRDDNHNRTPENLDTYQLVNVGDLVINKMKAWQGSLGTSEYHGITSPDYVVYAPAHDEDSRFLHYLLRAEAMADVYRSISNGIRPSQWRLEPENFDKLVIFLPPLSEQAQICQFIDAEDSRLQHLITQAQKLISCLNEYRTALISSAVTGKIDVREEIA